MTKFETYSDSGDNLPVKIYVIILTGTVLWLMLICLAPFMMQLGGSAKELSLIIYFFFSKTCHQMDDRSFHFFGYKFAVCSRCFSIYSGFLAGTIIYPFINKITKISFPKPFFLIGSTVPVIADVILDKAGILHNTFLSRSVTGFLFGAVLPFYLIPGFVRFYYEVNSYLRKKFSPEN